MQHEQNKQERKLKSREQKEVEETRMFELKQQRKSIMTVIWILPFT